ncbi:hypothetical protein SK128_007888 [Halocaridina rubra]|uniref:Uncharacterized protein n=1 Tax=Halocaridina rubra TaxID=373956 RepID=A0AAN9AG33_HALRR
MTSSSSSCSLTSPSSPNSEYGNNNNSKYANIFTNDEKESDCGVSEKPSNGLSSNSTEIIEGLERELQDLQMTLDEAEKEWKQDRTSFPLNGVKVGDEIGFLEDELQEVEAERMRLALIEDKLRQLLQVLLSVADLNLSRRTLGRLVLEAVEDAAGVKLGDIGFEDDKTKGKVSPLTFLSNLLSSTANYHALSTESLLHLAFENLSFPPCIPELPEPVEATLA